MKIALFGASGGTGIEFLNQSQNSNFEITAFLRSPEKLREQFPTLRMVKASIDEVDVLTQNTQGFDAIVSLVGISGLLQARKPNSIYERTARSLIKVSKENQIKKLIVVSSGGVVEAENEPWFFKHLLKPIFLNKMYDDMRIMEDLISKSGLNYTLVRPPYLTKGKLTKTYRTIIDSWFVDDKVLSRADLAHFLLDCINREDLTKKIVGVSY